MSDLVGSKYCLFILIYLIPLSVLSLYVNDNVCFRLICLAILPV